jgi:type II secretory pathway component PulC
VRRLALLVAVCLVACSPTLKTSCAPPASQVYVFASAHWTPVQEGGVVRGVEASDVVPGSFPACLGLRDGDRLVELDGQPIDDPTIFSQLGKRREVHLRVENASGRSRLIVNH